MNTCATLLCDAAWARSPRQAAELYRRALELAEPGSADHVDAGAGLGEALERIDVARALVHYRAMLAGDQAGAHTYAYERLPILCEKRGEYELALDAIRLAVRRGAPTDVAFRRRAWRIADAGGLARPCVPLRLPAWRAGERRTEMFWFWAELARDRKAWARAARRYERVGAARFPEAQTWLGHCREKLGEIGAALGAYGRAMDAYEWEHLQRGAYAVIWRKPFDRSIIILAQQGEFAGAWHMVERALWVIQRKPPDSWWKRAARIAEACGKPVNRESWEEAFEARRWPGPELDEERRAAVARGVDELGEFWEGMKERRSILTADERG